MSAQDTVKEPLDLQAPMTQFNGKPIKDLTEKALPPQMKADEYQKIVDEAEPLRIGLFLAQIIDSFKNIESLKDMRYWRGVAIEVSSATLKKSKFEVNLPWLDKVMEQLEKERKDLPPNWNTPTYIGQLVEHLDSAKLKIQNKIEKIKGK